MSKYVKIARDIKQIREELEKSAGESLIEEKYRQFKEWMNPSQKAPKEIQKLAKRWGWEVLEYYPDKTIRLSRSVGRTNQIIVAHKKNRVWVAKRTEPSLRSKSMSLQDAIEKVIRD